MRRVSTGVPGLDPIVEGGFPSRRVVLVVGGPGSGKTILSVQFLVHGAVEGGERVLYLSLEEKKEDLYREMLRFGWDLESLEKSGRFVFADATETITRASTQPGVLPRFGGGPPLPLLGLIEFHQQKTPSTRIAVDPVSSLALQYPDPVERREAVVKLVNALAKSGATCVLTSELRAQAAREVQLEEYLCHGVVILRVLKSGKTLVRGISIEKMRETDVDPQVRPYRIGPTGFEVFPKETVL